MNWLAALVVSLHLPASPMPLPAHTACAQPCSVSPAGKALIREYEGFSPVAYHDVAGKMTIGVGHLIVKGEDFTRPLSPDEADALLTVDAGKAAKAVNKHVTVTLYQHQFDALTSFTFNLGGGALASSTLLKKVNAGNDNEVPAQFLRWCNAGGVPVEGLKRRRKSEAVMYVG